MVEKKEMAEMKYVINRMHLAARLVSAAPQPISQHPGQENRCYVPKPNDRTWGINGNDGT